MFHRYLYNKSVSSQIFISKHLSDLKGQYDAKIVYILFRSPFKIKKINLAWSISYLVPNIFGFKKMRMRSLMTSSTPLIL